MLCKLYFIRTDSKTQKWKATVLCVKFTGCPVIYFGGQCDHHWLTRINTKLKLRRKKISHLCAWKKSIPQVRKVKMMQKTTFCPSWCLQGTISLGKEKSSKGYKESKWDPASIQAVDITHRTCCCSFRNSVAEGKLQSPWDLKGLYRNITRELKY